MADGFECSFCGTCCRSFGKAGKNLGELESRIEAERGPLYYMTSAEKLRPWMFSWEAEKLSRLDPNFRYTPRTFIYDLKTDTPLVVYYNIDHDECIFLDRENKCRVYESRPLVCRSFPLVESGIRKDKLNFSRYGCPQAVDVRLPELMTDMEYASLMMEAYGDTFLWSVAKDAANHWLKSNILEAEESGFILMLRNTSQREAVRKAEDRTPADFMEHLCGLKRGFGREIAEKIECLYDIDYARKTLDEVL